MPEEHLEEREKTRLGGVNGMPGSVVTKHSPPTELDTPFPMPQRVSKDEPQRHTTATPVSPFAGGQNQVRASANARIQVNELWPWTLDLRL
jgi:uncharacterized protein YggE